MEASEPPAKPPDGVGSLPYSSGKTFAVIVVDKSSIEYGYDVGEVLTYRGEPALKISRKELMELMKPFQNALIGWFPYSRPSMVAVHNFFISLGLKGDCSVGLLDCNQILIRPMVEEDYVTTLPPPKAYSRG